MKPFIALIYNDSKDYSRNRAAGMSYLNRFLIEEDTQFECAEIVEWKLGSSWENSVQDLEKKFIKLSKKSNSDFIRHLFLSMDIFPNQKLSNILTDQPFKSLIKGLRTFSDTSHMITRIASRRLECVQKEHYECIQKEAYEKLYRERDKIEYNELRTDEVHQSIGNDIDDFYDRIKMNEINFVDRKLRKSPNSVKTFHLSMLSDQEEKKMYRSFQASSSVYEISEDYNRVNSEDYSGENFQEHLNKSSRFYYEEHSEHFGGRFENFKNVTAVSKKETNYALSLCARKTFFYTYKMGDMNAYLLEY